MSNDQDSLSQILSELYKSPPVIGSLTYWGGERDGRIDALRAVAERIGKNLVCLDSGEVMGVDESAMVQMLNEIRDAI